MKRRGLLHIHADEEKLLEDGYKPGSGAHRQKAGQDGAQEEHGEKHASAGREGSGSAASVCVQICFSHFLLISNEPLLVHTPAS